MANKVRLAAISPNAVTAWVRWNCFEEDSRIACSYSPEAVTVMITAAKLSRSR